MLNESIKFLNPKDLELFGADVIEIYAHLWDCVGMHVLALQFNLKDGTHISINDDEKNWSELLIATETYFPEFNKNKLNEVERFFPGEGSLLCWKR